MSADYKKIKLTNSKQFALVDIEDYKKYDELALKVYGKYARLNFPVRR